MSDAQLVQNLDNVLTRLALTTEDNLEKVLSKLIPAVIRQLKNPSLQVKDKVIQILTHVNKRLEASQGLQLPLEDLSTVFLEADKEDNSLVRSFALIYIEKAFKSSIPQSRLAVFPSLMKNVSRRPTEQKNTLLRLGMAALEDYPLNQSEEVAKKLKTENSPFEFLDDPGDKICFLEFSRRTILYQTSQKLPGVIDVRVGGDQASLPPEAEARLIKVPPGLSSDMAKTVEGKSPLGEDQLRKRKIGILNFLKDVSLEKESFLIFLITSADPVGEVSKLAEHYLKKHFRIEQDSKDVDLEDASLIRSILDLMNGTEIDGDLLNLDNLDRFVVPVSNSAKAKLLDVLNHSVEAASQYPHNIRTVWSCVFGKNVPMSLRQQAMEYSVWIVKHARPDVLAQLGNPMLNEMLELLDRNPAAAQKGYIYGAIAQLAQRIPAIFHDKIKVVEDLFEALETEPAGLRSQLQSAVSSLANAFKLCDTSTEILIKNLLMNSIQSHSSVVRLTAVTWSMRLFSFGDPVSRLICIIGAGDDKAEVKREGELGIDWSSFSRETSSAESWVSIPDMLRVIRENSVWLKTSLDKSPTVYRVLIEFLAKIQSVSDKVAEENAAKELLGIYEGALKEGNPFDLLVEAFKAMLSLLAIKRETVIETYKPKLDFLLKWVVHLSGEVRTASSQLIGVVSSAANPQSVIQLAEQLKEKAQDVKSTFESRVGSVQVLGPLSYITCNGSFAVGYIGGNCSEAAVLQTIVRISISTLVPLLSSGNLHLESAVALSLSHQSLSPDFLPALSASTTPSWFSDRIGSKLKQLTASKDLSVVSKAAFSMGLFCKAFTDPTIDETFLLHLLSLKDIKNDDLQHTVGEAMALAFAKDTISNDLILATSFTSLRDSALDVASLRKPTPVQKVHDSILDAILEGMISSRSEHRAACSSHLVALMTYCPLHDSILARLERAQRNFVGLLGDKSSLTQEMASIGVSLVYNLGDADMKSKLLEGLTGVLKNPANKGKTVKLDADSEVLEEGTLGKGSAAGLTTYKELCSLASDMGQPNLVYKFLDLANHQAAVNSRRGAAEVFTKIADLAGQDLKPYLPEMLPRIYRMRFDPNPAVQETMNRIWSTLVSDSRDKVDEFFPLILKELETEITGNLWRHRESSCRAFSDLLQGRSWPALREAFPRIWRLSFRAVDDIRQSVRNAGLQLVKLLKRLTLRFVDPHLSEGSIVVETVAAVLPVLLEAIEKQSVIEIVAAAFTTLSSIASTSSPDMIRPHLAALVPVLLESLSQSESSAINELHLNATGAGIDTDSLDSIRIQASASSPIQEILNRCAMIVDKGTLEQGDLVQKLRELIQRGVGLNTRVGTTRFVSQVASHLGSDFAPFAWRFLKVLLSKSFAGEPRSAVKKAYASTIASICRSAESKTMDRVVTECVKALKENEGSDKTVIGLIFKELQSRASEAMMGYSSSIMPIAFVLRFDSRESVASIWMSVLEDGMGTEGGTIRLYGREIAEEAKFAFGMSKWDSKVAACKAIGRMFEVGKELVAELAPGLMRMLLDQIPGRIWEGKEFIFKSVAKICGAVAESVDGFYSEIIDLLKASCIKGRREYREGALESLSLVLASRRNKDDYSGVIEFLLEKARESLEPVDKEEEEGGVKLPLKLLMKCLVNARTGLDAAELRDPKDGESVELFVKIIGEPRDWQTKVGALDALTTMLEGTTFSTGQLQSHLDALTQAVLICLQEQKHEKLREVALTALDKIVDCCSRHKISGEHSETKAKLSSHLETEKSFALKEKITELLKKYEHL